MIYVNLIAMGYFQFLEGLESSVSSKFQFKLMKNVFI